MPNILVSIPQGAFPGEARVALVRRINDAAAQAEQIPRDPKKRFLCWVVINQIDSGAWTCGGVDVTPQWLPGDDKRQLATSVVLHEVADGAWGASGVIWKLPDFARAAGFEHLQHLAAA